LDPKIQYKLTFILPLIAMLTKEPEMLQPDAFCEHTMQQNATAAGVPPRTRWGSLQRSPDPLAGFRGSASRRGKGKGGKTKGGRGREKDGRGGRKVKKRAADWLSPALPKMSVAKCFSVLFYVKLRLRTAMRGLVARREGTEI